jgi:hypothetical protein
MDLTPKEILAETQRIRMKFIKDQVAMNPTDIDTLNKINSLMSSADSAALKTMELDISERSIGGAQQVADAARLLIEQLGRNMFRVETPIGRSQPDVDLPDINPLPGQDRIGVEILDPDDFKPRGNSEGRGTE